MTLIFQFLLNGIRLGILLSWSFDREYWLSKGRMTKTDSTSDLFTLINQFFKNIFTYVFHISWKQAVSYISAWSPKENTFIYLFLSYCSPDPFLHSVSQKTQRKTYKDVFEWKPVNEQERRRVKPPQCQACMDSCSMHSCRKMFANR